MVTEQNLLDDINNLVDSPAEVDRPEGEAEERSLKKLSTITNAKLNLRNYGLRQLFSSSKPRAKVGQTSQRRKSGASSYGKQASKLIKAKMSSQTASRGTIKPPQISMRPSVLIIEPHSSLSNQNFSSDSKDGEYEASSTTSHNSFDRSLIGEQEQDRRQSKLMLAGGLANFSDETSEEDEEDEEEIDRQLTEINKISKVSG